MWTMCLFWQSKIWCHMLLVTIFAEPAAAHFRHQVHHPEPAASKAMGQGKSTQGGGQEGSMAGHYTVTTWASHRHRLNHVGPRWWPNVVGPEVFHTRLQVLGVSQQDQVWGAPSLCNLPKAMGDQFPRNWATLHWWHSQLKAIYGDNGHWTSSQRKISTHGLPCLVGCCRAMFLAMSFGISLAFHCHHHVGYQEGCL